MERKGCRELPRVNREWQNGEKSVANCHELPECGRNMGSGGTATSYQKITEVRGEGEAVKRCELSRIDRNEERGEAVACCQKLLESGGSGGSYQRMAVMEIRGGIEVSCHALPKTG